MKIPKFLVGGSPSFQVIANPFAAPAEDSSTTSGSKKSSSGSKSGLLSESLLNELYKKGIPVDVDNFVQKLAQYEQQEQWGLGVSPAAIRGLEAQANRIIQQANYLNRAENFAEKNQAMGEIAVGSKGQLYIQDKDDNVKAVGMSEYDPEKHGYALTVGDLIEQRKFNPNKAYDTDLTQTINNNLGMQKINEYIQGIIKTVGDSQTTSEAYTDLASYVGKQYAKRPTEAQLKNLQNLAEALQQLGPDAIFKNKEIMKSRNMQEAFEYIRSVLPRDMRIQLSGRWIANGGTTDSAGKYMDSIIAQALTAANKTEYGDYLDFDANVNKAVNPAKNGSNKTFYQKPNEQLFDGDLNQMILELRDPVFGNQTGVKVAGSQMPALTTDDGNAISNLPLGVAFNATVGKYLEKDKMYMGDQKITEGMLNDIAYSNDPVAAIYMPVDRKHNIDWEGFHGFSAAEQEIRDKNITDIDQKNQIHAAHNSYAHYDQNGNLVPDTLTERFLLTYGYTIDDKIADNNQMVEELTEDQEDAADQLLKTIYNKALKNKYGISGITNKQTWDDIFRVPIFIKINEFAAQDAYRYGGHGSSMVPKTLEEDMMNQQFATPRQPQMIGNSNLLYQE